MKGLHWVISTHVTTFYTVPTIVGHGSASEQEKNQMEPSLPVLPSMRVRNIID